MTNIVIMLMLISIQIILLSLQISKLTKENKPK